MDIGSLLISAALAIVVAFVVAQPLVEGRNTREKPVSQLDRLTAERETVLTALRDLDFDHATGKLSDEDYAPQRAALVAQGVEVLKQLEAAGHNGKGRAEDALEREISRRRKSPTAKNVDELIEAEVESRRRGAAKAFRAPEAAGRADDGAPSPARPAR